MRAASNELICIGHGSTLACTTPASIPEGTLVTRSRKALSSHLEVCPHGELLERPRIGQSLRDYLAGEMVDNTDEKLGHLGGGSLVFTSTAAVGCALPCRNPEVRSVQFSGVDALFFPLLLEARVVAVCSCFSALVWFWRRMPFKVIGTPEIISATPLVIPIGVLLSSFSRLDHLRTGSW